MLKKIKAQAVQAPSRPPAKPASTQPSAPALSPRVLTKSPLVAGSTWDEQVVTKHLIFHHLLS